MEQLLEILRKESRDIVEEFNLASIQGRGTPQEIADFREHAIQNFVARFYPRSHIVSKGKVTDIDGNQSNSIDCLILNPVHPNLIDSKGKFRLIYSDGCDAAIEVKPNISRMDELLRGLDQCITVKQVRRSKSALFLRGRQSQHIFEHSRYIPFYIFSLESYSPEELYERIYEYYKQNAISLEHQIDGICVLNSGMLINVKHQERNYYGAEPPLGQSKGWYFEKWLDLSLIGLLFNHLGSNSPKLASALSLVLAFSCERICT